MKYRIVICVLIYFELVASYPYGEEYSEANQSPSERRLRFSNFAQPQNVLPRSYYQNGFTPTTRPYFDNVGAYRASNDPLETGSDLKPRVQGENNDNLNQQKNIPVQQLLPQQIRFNNEYLENRAKLSQFQAQHAAVPNLNSVDEFHLNPAVQQYHPVDHVENIGNAGAFRPQYYSNDRNLPFTNVLPSSRTLNIQKLENDPLKIKGLDSNIRVDQINNAQDLPSNIQIPNVTGNDNLQRLLNNPRLREILATTKNKKRYMVIYPNGKVEHLDSIEPIAAQYPNHLVFNSAAVNQISDNFRLSSLTPSNIPPSLNIPPSSNIPRSSNIPSSPALPLNSNVPLFPEVLPQYPRQLVSLNIPLSPSLPLNSNAPLSPKLPPQYPPQLTSSDAPRLPVTTHKSNTSLFPTVPPLPPQDTSSNITRPPTNSLKSNTLSSSISPTYLSQLPLSNTPLSPAVLQRPPSLNIPPSSNIPSSPVLPLNSNVPLSPELPPQYPHEFVSLNIPPSPALPLNSYAPLSPEPPPQYPHQFVPLNIPPPAALPLNSNTPLSPELPPQYPPQLTSSDTPQLPVTTLKSDTSSFPTVPPLPPQVTSSNITRPPTILLKSNTLSSSISPTHPPQLPLSNTPLSPAVPLKPNTPSSPVLLPPQATSSNLPRPPTIPPVPNAQSTHDVLLSTHPPLPASSNISRPPNFPLKSNAPSSAGQPTTITPYLNNSSASKSAAVPVVPPVIPVLQKSTSKSTAKKSFPESTNPHVSSKQKTAYNLPLPEQLHSLAQLVSSDTRKAGVSPVSNSKLTKIKSTHRISSIPVKAAPNGELPPPKKTSTISPLPTSSPPVLVQNMSSIPTTNNSINHTSVDDSKNNKTFESTVLHDKSSSYSKSKANSSSAKIGEKSLPLTITEVNPKLISSNHSTVTSSVSANEPNQKIGSKDIHINSLTSENKDNKNASSVKSVPKPVAMVSPTQVTLSAPIDLADLFPITKEYDANMMELSNSTVTSNKTTDSTESLITKSDSYTLDHGEVDKTASATDDDKQIVSDTAANVSTSAVHEQHDENRNESEESDSNNLSSNNSSQTEMQSDSEERPNHSVNQTTSQPVSNEDTHLDTQAVYKKDSASPGSPSSPKEPSNTEADCSELKIPPKVDDTVSVTSFSTGSDETSQQSSSIVVEDEINDGKEELTNLIESKKNTLWSTPLSYEEIWKKLIGDGTVTMVYFLQMPSQNIYEKEEVNGNTEHNIL